MSRLSGEYFVEELAASPREKRKHAIHPKLFGVYYRYLYDSPNAD
jgi:hypothetical protein